MAVHAGGRGPSPGRGSAEGGGGSAHLRGGARRWHAERIVPRYRASAQSVWRYFERDCKTLFPRRLDTITRRHIAALVEAKKADGHNRRWETAASAPQDVPLGRCSPTRRQASPLDALDAGDLEIEKADPRDRLASDDELRTVWNLPAPHGPMLRFVLLTACRVGEGEGGAARADPRRRLDARADEEREDARAAAEQDGSKRCCQRAGRSAHRRRSIRFSTAPSRG